MFINIQMLEEIGTASCFYKYLFDMQTKSFISTSNYYFIKGCRHTVALSFAVTK